MTFRLQLIVAVAVVIALLYIGNLVRIRRLELKYALVWFFVGVLLLFFDLAPGMLNALTRLLGIALPINMLFFLGFGFVLIIIFTQTVVISNLTRRVKRLTQEVAMLNKRVDNRVEQADEVKKRLERLERRLAQEKSAVREGQPKADGASAEAGVWQEPDKI